MLEAVTNLIRLKFCVGGHGMVTQYTGLSDWPTDYR